jgi:hypothetical protein
MRNIIITESKFNELVELLMNEAVGVPENILEVSEEIYKSLLDEIDNLTSVEEQYVFNLSSDYRVSDESFSDLNVTLMINSDPSVVEPSIVSMGLALKSATRKSDFRLQHVFNNLEEMSIILSFPENWNLDDLKTFFIENESEFLSSFAHEVKHTFDFRKKKVEKSEPHADYKSYAELSIGIPPIDKFLFSLYFIHSIENLVRPVELASLLKSHNVTRKEFYDYFIETKLFTTLKRIQTDTYENFREEIGQYLPDLRDYLSTTKGLNDLDQMTDDEVIDIVLNLTYEAIANAKFNIMMQMLLDSPLELVMGFAGSKDQFFKKFMRNVIKYKNNPNEFFISEFNNFKIVSTKMIKKLSKLFSIVPVKKTETTESKSIKNWDLHHKYKGTKKLFPIKRKTTT